MMPDKHLSTQFDSELNDVCARVMQLGGLAESQVRRGFEALLGLDAGSVDEVIATEARVNLLEVEIDRELSSIIARRQPTARDLRLLIAVSRTTANLERAGDEAVKIARMAKSVVEGKSAPALPADDLRVSATLAAELLGRSLDAFARLDTAAALSILREDGVLDREFLVVVRRLIDRMMADRSRIPAAIDLLFVAKAIERIGDHAKNIAEAVIYIVKGADVRHEPMDRIESALR